GLRGLKKPRKELYLGNSGTTMRVILGILAGQDFECVLSGDESLSKRPMRRVAEPLEMMGAEISSEGRAVRGEGKEREIYPPLKIRGRYPLKAIKYKMPVASAQVKSAILLAGLYAGGVTQIEEPYQSRDHTEKMLNEFGAKIKKEGLRVSIENSALKSRGGIFVPGDISSAAFFIVAALILKSSRVAIKNVGVNPTRAGIIDVLKKMGAGIEAVNMRNQEGEPWADIIASSSDLEGVMIEGGIMPRVIDELPILMVAASLAKGKTVIREAAELRVKETDRISSMVTNLKKMGADIKAEGNTIIINGKDELTGARVDSFGDHRTAMSMAIAGLRAKGETTVSNADCVNKSFPGFEEAIKRLT
ncbi:MAG: 3-phosphoshikimate 1-carboxyvinyltransferase, partial [Candidatus Omnitrophica bacterium]|nr:3-phosphoshikimate 1-carboxyvinyltransferase [Candidatus Omnitrophota bacterium]